MSSSWQHFFVGSLQVACSATATSNKVKSVVFLTMNKLSFLPHSISETHLLRNYHSIKVSCTLCILDSMTSLLTHTVPHSTRPSYRPKIDNQPLKKFVSLVVSWVKVVKMAKFWLSESIFWVKNYPNLPDLFFIEEYDFRGTLFVIDIFGKLHFLLHFIF